jgi:hypothetical protein
MRFHARKGSCVEQSDWSAHKQSKEKANDVPTNAELHDCGNGPQYDRSEICRAPDLSHPQHAKAVHRGQKGHSDNTAVCQQASRI